MIGRDSLIVALALVKVVAGHPKDSASICCSILSDSKSLSGLIFTPQTAEYDTLINDRWSSTSILHPGCVVTPRSAEDVSAAIKIFTQNQCEFAVKSGGHNANPGANSIDGGVSLDLGALQTARLAPDRSYVSLDAGVTWGEAYDAFTDTGIAFTGGICEDVGVSGVALGGGQSLFQPKKGWVVDNILNYQVVLASGDIVNANQTSYPDLFKALKGGNTNFGVVTKVDVAAFDFEKLWGGEVFVGLADAEVPRSDVIDRMGHALTDFVAENNHDLDSAVQLMTLYLSGGRGQTVIAAFVNTEGVENPKALQPFLNLPNQVRTSVGHTKLADFVHKVSELQPKGFRQVTASVTFTNHFQTARDVWDAADAIYNSLEFKNEVDWMISFIPQPKIQQSYAAERGGNSLGLADVEDDQVVFWLTSRWTDPNLDANMEDARQRVVDDVEAVAKRHGTYHPFIYVNYAAPTQNPLCGYGSESVSFLKVTAAKYDPDGVFQRLMSGGFKLDQAYCG